MKRTNPEKRYSPPTGDMDKRCTNRATDSATADASKQATSPSGRSTVNIFSRADSIAAESASGFASMEHANDRREAWLDRGHVPSFEFDSIDDEHVLGMEAAQRKATPALPTGARGPDEKTRRLMGIAADIQKTMETDVASILKKLACLSMPHHSASSAVKDALKTFSLFIKHFQAAKIAAGASDQAQMTSELEMALGVLDGFVSAHVGPSASKPLAFKGASSTLHKPLTRLASLCRTWAEMASPTPGPATSRGDHAPGSPEPIDSQARSRSVSSPDPVTGKPVDSGRPGSNSAALAPPGNKASYRRATTETGKTASQTTTAGQKLKALFSRSGASGSRKGDDGNVSDSPRSRSSSGAATSASASGRVVSAPDSIGPSPGSMTSSPVKSLRRMERDDNSDG